MKKNLKEKILLVIIAIVLVFLEHITLFSIKGVAGSWWYVSFLDTHPQISNTLSLYLPLIFSILYVLISKDSFFKKVVVLVIALFILLFVITAIDGKLTEYCQYNNNNMCEEVYDRFNNNR